MSPSELRDLKQAHRVRCTDLIGIALVATVAVLLIFFHRSPLAWAVVSWVLAAGAGVILMGAARRGDDTAEQVLRARRQELKAREDTRPHANVSRINGGGS
jgi:hypothetical protein